MSIPRLFSEIEQLIPQLPGWCTNERAFEFAATIIAMRPKISLEIGVFGGRGSLACAMAHALVGHGRCIAIDPWKADDSVKGMTGDNLTWWSALDHEQIYQQFIQRIGSLGVANCIDVVRKRSDDYAPPVGIGLLIIDGNHSDQAIKDAKRYAPCVPVGGVIYMDDLNWDGGGPLKASKHLLKTGFRKMHERDHGAFFQRVS